MRERNHLILSAGSPRPMVGYGAHVPPGMPAMSGRGSAASATGHGGDGNVLRSVLRHFWLVVIFTLLGAGAAALYMKYATPLYRATARIYIEQAAPRAIAEAFGAGRGDNWLDTQCSVIRSTPVLSLVADAPGLSDLPTFATRSGSPVNYLRSKKHLETEVGSKDDIISVSVYTPFQEDAAKIVNAVIEAYTRYSTTEKRTRSSDLLNTYVEAKQRADKEISTLQDQLFHFQRDNPNLALEAAVDLQLRSVSHAFVESQIAVIDARGRYAANHPARLAAERRERELLENYRQITGASSDLNSLQAEHQRMQAEMANKRELARGLEAKIRELEVNKDAEQVFRNITLIETEEPDRPSSPQPVQVYAVALMAGLLMGGSLALLRDRMDTRMRSIEEIQTIIGLPVLGVVPAMSGRRTAIARAMTVHLDPRSVVAESYRTVRTALYFGAGENHCKTILITSPEPGDGKTTSASNLAIAIAQTGRRVLLLDADFRKPTQHKNLAVGDSPGLSSVLAGREPLSKVLQHTGVEGLDILPCGPIPANPSEILNSREFGELVDDFARQYDHIVFDSPPVNAVTDARILGAVSDATILVIRADKSTRQSAEHARNALMAVGARLLGVIVNDAPRRKGYDVYGGSYYGQTDIAVRSHDGYDGSPQRPRLPNPSSAVAE